MRRVILWTSLLSIAVIATATGSAHWQGVAESRRSAAARTGGDPDRGRAAIEAYGCGSCHTIPGVTGADGLVGPPLEELSGRAYVGGVLANNGQNLVRWIMNAPAVDPLTAMPNLNVTEPDARDIAAYIYSLR